MDFKDFLTEAYGFQKNVESKNSSNHHLYAESLQTWNNRHMGALFGHHSTLHYNQIIRVDFGITCIPEMGFRHPALLMKYDNQFCKVLPITSSSHKVGIAYHPTIRPTGNKSYFLIPKGTCALTKDSCVLIHQSKTISESRIQYIEDPNGLPNDMYKEIRSLTFAFDFPEMYSQLCGAEKNIMSLRNQIEILNGTAIQVEHPISTTPEIIQLPEDCAITNIDIKSIDNNSVETVTIESSTNNDAININFVVKNEKE